MKKILYIYAVIFTFASFVQSANASNYNAAPSVGVVCTSEFYGANDCKCTNDKTGEVSQICTAESAEACHKHCKDFCGISTQGLLFSRPGEFTVSGESNGYCSE